MPVIKKLMKKLADEYGAEKSKNVYYGMENSGKLDKAKATIASRKKK